MSEESGDTVTPGTRAGWREWLEQHHTRTTGIWLINYRKASGKPHIEYDASVEEALCFGWIDSKPRARDAESSMLWFAPRKPGTGWSRPNKARVERMIALGLMAPAGMAKVAAARQDGSWNALDAVEDLVVPPDLEAALHSMPPAAAHFAAFPRSAKRGILEWIQNAKRAETRARRIDETARLARAGVRANQWRR